MSRLQRMDDRVLDAFSRRFEPLTEWLGLVGSVAADDLRMLPRPRLRARGEGVAWFVLVLIVAIVATGLVFCALRASGSW